MKREYTDFNHTLAKFFLRSARGQGIISRFSDPIRDMFDGSVYLFAIQGLTGLSLPLYVIPIIVISKKLIEPMVAWLDEKRVGLWKAENYYTAYELSPYNQEVLKILKNIEKKV